MGTSGQLDRSFGHHGKVRLNLGGDDHASAGRIIAAGFKRRDFTLVRVHG